MIGNSVLEGLPGKNTWWVRALAGWLGANSTLAGCRRSWIANTRAIKRHYILSITMMYIRFNRKRLNWFRHWSRWVWECDNPDRCPKASSGHGCIQEFYILWYHGCLQWEGYFRHLSASPSSKHNLLRTMSFHSLNNKVWRLIIHSTVQYVRTCSNNTRGKLLVHSMVEFSCQFLLPGYLAFDFGRYTQGTTQKDSKLFPKHFALSRLACIGRGV